MEDAELRLDGNAAAGLLREVFVYDLSGATGQCASCGAIADVGGQHLYMQPLSPGAVLRCRSCGSVLMVFVHHRGRYRFGLQGLKWLEIRETVEAAAGSA
jgi:hypothetical protein